MTDLKKNSFAVLSILFCFLFTTSLFAQEQLVIDWQKSLGGDKNEIAYASVETSDGGVIIVGSTNSRNSFDVKDSKGYDGAGGSDMWIVKLSASRAIEWSKTFGGTKDDVATGVVQAQNGEYVVIGTTLSTDADANFNGTNGGLLMVRLNLKGDLISKRVFAGGSRFQDAAFQSANSQSKATIKLASNGELIIGATKSSGSGTAKTFDFFLARLTATGDTLWERTYGGGLEDYMNDFIICSDGGIMMVGTTLSLARDIPGAGKGFYDFLVVKASSTGAELWKKAYGGTSYDVLYSLIEIGQTNQYYLAGETSSSDGDVGKGLGQKDGILLKINSTGTVLSKSLLGGAGNDGFMHLTKGKDGKLYFLGSSDSVIGAVKPKGPVSDFWMMVMEESGTVNYHKLFGGAEVEVARHGFAASDGGILVSGSSRSSDGDASLNRGQSDFWLVKLQVPPPIVFGKFEAFLNDAQEIELAWTSTYEKNAQTIFLEKSTDNKTFQRIYDVAAAGTPAVIKSYGFRDKNPVIGQNYYRLRYNDKANKMYEGRTASFNFVPLASEPLTGREHVIYPNPAFSFVRISNFQAGTSVELINGAGQLVQAARTMTDEGELQLNLPDHLSTGAYFIRILHKNNSESIKLLIAR